MAYKRLDGKSSTDVAEAGVYFFSGLLNGSFDEDAPDMGAPDLPQMQAPEQPQLEPVPEPEPVQIAEAAPAPTPTTELPVQAQSPGLMEGVGKWFKDLSPEAQQVIAKSFQGGAAALMQGLAQKSAQEDALERENRRREDQQRRGQVPSFGSAFAPRA